MTPRPFPFRGLGGGVNQVVPMSHDDLDRGPDTEVPTLQATNGCLLSAQGGLIPLEKGLDGLDAGIGAGLQKPVRAIEGDDVEAG